MKKKYDPEEIVQLLEKPTEDRRPLKHMLIKEAYLNDIIEALRIAKTSLTRQILCDVLRHRHRSAKSSIPVLIECLDDSDWKVRSDAAEALTLIGGKKAGEAILKHFKRELLPAYAFGLGFIGIREAIPELINALKSDSHSVRAGSAWSLGKMKALEARMQLEEALKEEKDDWVKAYLQKAIDSLNNP